MAEQVTLQTRMSTSNSQEWSTAKGRTATIINRIHAAKNLDELFFELKGELATLLPSRSIFTRLEAVTSSNIMP